MTTESRSKHVYEKFDVADFGIDTNQFLSEIDPSLDELPWDLFDVRAQHFRILTKQYPECKEYLTSSFPQYYSGSVDFNTWLGNMTERVEDDIYQHLGTVSPFRKRSMTQLTVQFDSDTPTILRKETSPYLQHDMGGYIRSLPRDYPEVPDPILQHPAITHLISEFSMRVRSMHPDIREMIVKIHPTSVVCRPSQHSKPSLEGIHNDGADYIISALVISRKNILGGESIVYDNDKKAVLARHILEPGEGIFQNDSDLYHDVTPIYRSLGNGQVEGIRNMIGFDFLLHQDADE